MDAERYGRRRWLASLGTLVASGIAGCAGTVAGRDRSVGVDPRSPCAEAFRLTEQRADIELGTVPEVTLRISNTGSAPIAYELLVVFVQGTSLGIDARTGRDVLSGTLAPGETVDRVATDDAPDIRNTGGYELEVSLTCEPG